MKLEYLILMIGVQLIMLLSVNCEDTEKTAADEAGYFLMPFFNFFNPKRIAEENSNLNDNTRKRSSIRINETYDADTEKEQTTEFVQVFYMNKNITQNETRNPLELLETDKLTPTKTEQSNDEVNSGDESMTSDNNDSENESLTEDVQGGIENQSAEENLQFPKYDETLSDDSLEFKKVIPLKKTNFVEKKQKIFHKEIQESSTAIPSENDKEIIDLNRHFFGADQFPEVPKGEHIPREYDIKIESPQDGQPKEFDVEVESEDAAPEIKVDNRSAPHLEKEESPANDEIEPAVVDSETSIELDSNMAADDSNNSTQEDPNTFSEDIEAPRENDNIKLSGEIESPNEFRIRFQEDRNYQTRNISQIELKDSQQPEQDNSSQIELERTETKKTITEQPKVRFFTLKTDESETTEPEGEVLDAEDEVKQNTPSKSSENSEPGTELQDEEVDEFFQTERNASLDEDDKEDLAAAGAELSAELKGNNENEDGSKIARNPSSTVGRKLKKRPYVAEFAFK